MPKFSLDIVSNSAPQAFGPGRIYAARGSSSTEGIGASSPNARYANQIAAYFGWNLFNQAVAGDLIDTQWRRIVGVLTDKPLSLYEAIVGTKVYSAQMGTNDLANWTPLLRASEAAINTNLAVAGAGVTSFLSHLAIADANKTFASETAAVKVGTWNAVSIWPSNSTGKFSQGTVTPNATITFSVRGTRIGVVITAVAAQASFTITVDGTVRTSSTSDAGAVAGGIYMPVIFWYDVPDGLHTVVVTKDAGVGALYVAYCTGVGGSNGQAADNPTLLALSATSWGVGGANTPYAGRQQDEQTLNDITRLVVTELAASGLKAYFVDANAAVNNIVAPAAGANIDADGVHVNDAGNLKISAEIINTVNRVSAGMPAVEPLQLIGRRRGVDLNATTTSRQLVPVRQGLWKIRQIIFSNASVVPTLATVQVNNSAGTALVAAATLVGVTPVATGTVSSTLTPTANTIGQTGPLYVQLTIANGTASTVDISIYGDRIG